MPAARPNLDDLLRRDFVLTADDRHRSSAPGILDHSNVQHYRVARPTHDPTAQSPSKRVHLSGMLKPGQFATVRVLLPQSEPAVLVPQRALRTISGSTYVFVIKNGHAEQRLIQAGQTEGDLVEIKSGVAENELVATSNVDQLSDGAAVRQ